MIKSKFLSGIGKQSRSMFMEMDANAAKTPSIVSAPQTPDIKKNSQVSPIWPPPIKTKVKKIKNKIGTTY